MHRKSTVVIAFAVFILFAILYVINKPQHALAQTAPPKPVLGKTILEGMALDEDSEPLYKHGFLLAMTIKNREGETIMTTGNAGLPDDLGGLYRFELKPGIYDIFVSNSAPANIRLKALRVNGVLVKGGKINKLDITLHRGEGLETIGEPVEPTLPAIVISDKFAQMQKQIDDLMARIDKLEKK